GAVLGSQGALARQIASLEAQRDTLAPGSPLRLFLDQYIADLAAIPSNISTIMDLHISQGSVTTKAGDVIGLRPIPGKVQYGAEGGLVKARPGGTLVNVAEAGSDELLIPLDGKHGVAGGGSSDGALNTNALVRAVLVAALSTKFTVEIEGTPLTAIVKDHTRAIAAAISAGRR
ncbi:MAG: hypothetical protein ABI862_15950, partial [Ilumatobacteraceae bacterium]